MTKILGLDLGTNSIGWAVVEKDKESFKLIEKGVRIFQEGVKIEKGIENSKAAERTKYRSARRLKFRRKLRKIETLKVLTEYGFCPKISEEDLFNWRYKKVYPTNELFHAWWKTDEMSNRNPYYFRSICATEKLDQNVENNRFIIGRALYHIAQRRGFLSNRLEGTKESDGAVKKNIEEINIAKGEKTLGQFFYEKYLKGEKIRDQYTHREEHYLEEFDKICEVQELSDDFKNKIYKAIFFQRPLKSQKGLIGMCVFEKNKQRCSVSHPLFEEYRMLCFVNNIRIQTPEDEKLRPLNEEERKKVIEKFYLKKDHFPFEDIAKALAPKNRYKYFKDRDKKAEDYIFNYQMNTTVSGNPVSARFKSIFGDDFLNWHIEHVRKKDGKTSMINIDDVWHVLMTFNNDEKLVEFAKNKLKLDDEQIAEFSRIKLKNEFASLSLKALKNILPYLRSGLIYSHAVVLANMSNALPQEIWTDEIKRNKINGEIINIIETQNEEKAIIEIINGIIKNCRENGECWSDESISYYHNDLVKGLLSYFGEKTYNSFPDEIKKRIESRALSQLKTQMIKNLGRGDFLKIQTIDERVKDFLLNNYKADIKKLDNIYHPSAIEVYKPAKKDDNGKKYLGSPLISSIRNPMAMRALHQLRKVINELINNEIIDENTKVNIEMSRGLLNANERKALQTWQRDRETIRKKYYESILEHYKAQGMTTQPSEDDVLKYQLWEEQGHKCIYTGEEIALSEFLGSNPQYDIEHTIPRSLSFDNSQENKTLCNNRFNRSIKKNNLPSEISNYDEIKERVERLWLAKIEELDKQVQAAIRASKGAAEKDSKDRAIQKRHRLCFERDYYRNKLSRFFMIDVPQGFKNSQLVDMGIIAKYGRLYMKTVFDKVYTVKGNTVADFRKMWGLQNDYEKKERVNHVHHCIDAVVIACMTKENYENLAKYYHDRDDSFINDTKYKFNTPKPWNTFTEDLKRLEDEVLISHYTPDVLPKQSKKKLRKRGRVVKDKNGNAIYQKGDSVRGSLHKDTFYGAIEKEIVNKNGEIEKQIKYVVRKALDNNFEDSNIKNIVDERVRQIVEDGRKKEKILRSEIDNLKKKLSKAEESEESILKSEIENLEKEIQKIYSLPNKNGEPIPIKKVRIYTPSVTNPIHLKKQRDKALINPKPYKEYFHVANDSNYMMAIYEGKDENGNIKRDFELKSNLEAAEFFKYSVQKELKAQNIEGYYGLIPKAKNNGKLELPLKSIIKIGTLVILWEKSPEEVWDLEHSEIKKRLYKIIGLSNQRIIRPSGKIGEYATIVLRFHQEATQASDLKVQDGAFCIDEEHKPQRKLNHNQFNTIVEGFDFKITALGKIIQL